MIAYLLCVECSPYKFCLSCIDFILIHTKSCVFPASPKWDFMIGRKNMCFPVSLRILLQWNRQRCLRRSSTTVVASGRIFGIILSKRQSASIARRCSAPTQSGMAPRVSRSTTRWPAPWGILTRLGVDEVESIMARLLHPISKKWITTCRMHQWSPDLTLIIRVSKRRLLLKISFLVWSRCMGFLPHLWKICSSRDFFKWSVLISRCHW